MSDRFLLDPEPPVPPPNVSRFVLDPDPAPAPVSPAASRFVLDPDPVPAPPAAVAPTLATPPAPVVAAPAPLSSILPGPDTQFTDPMSGMPMAPLPGAPVSTLVPGGVMDRDLEGQRAAAMADPISLGERFALNASDAYYGGTLAGSGQLIELQRAAQMSPQEWAEYNTAVRYAGGALRPLPSPAAAQAEIARITAARKRYETIPWSGGPLEFGAAIGGQLAGGLPSPESGINRVPGVAQGVGAISRAAPAIGRTVERAIGETGQAVAGRMLESGLSQAVVNTAVDPLAQVGSIATGMQPGYDPTRTVLAAPAGFVLGAGMHGAAEAAGAGVRALLPTPPVPATSPVDLAARERLAPAPVVGQEFTTERAGTPAPDPLSSVFTPPRTEAAPAEQFPATAAPAPPAVEPYAQTVVPAAPARIEAAPAPQPPLAETPAAPTARATPPAETPAQATTETPRSEAAATVPGEQSTPLASSPLISIGEPVDRPGTAAGRPGETAPVGAESAPGVEPTGIRESTRPGGDLGERPGDTQAARPGEQPVERPAVPAEQAARPAETPAGEPAPAVALATEPDHTVPGQHVAKNPAGEVVGKGASPEAARTDAQARQNALYAETPTAAPAAETAPTKRPVTKAELEALDKRARAAGLAAERASRDPNTTPERLATLRQRAEEAGAARAAAEGPPGRPLYKVGLTAKEMTAEHQRLTAEHEAAIDTRVHAEGTDPTPETTIPAVGRVFGMTGSTGIVRGQDAAGNTWVGTGNVILKNTPVMERAAAQEAKKPRNVDRPIQPEALAKVTTPDPKGDYQPVTWERQVTTPDGLTVVIGTKPDGTHVVVQKPVFDALHAAAGENGVILADTRAGKAGDPRLFVRAPSGQDIGVGMPMNARQEQARIWARGRERPAIAEAEAPARLEDQALVPGTREEAGTTGPRAPDLPEVRIERQPVRTADETLTKLQATRDALTNKVRTPAEERKLTNVNRQIARREAALEKTRAAEPRETQDLALEDQVEARGGGARRPFEGPPQVGRERDLLDYKFNDGTSVLRSVFEETGHNPDLAVNYPIKRQAEILSQHMVNKFGFTSVEIEGYRGKAATAVEQYRAVQAMLDTTRALQDGMATMGLPHDAASLGGALKLEIVPRGSTNWFGAYVFDGTIKVQAGANSYGHEWTHAIDHLLAERFTGNPANMNKLLTQYARGSGLDTSDNVQAAFAKLINTMFYDDVALATRRLALETQAAKVDKQGNPTKGALAAQDQLKLMEGAGSKLSIHSSEFRRESAAFRPKQADYWASVMEMLARSHEAYMANEMQLAGRDPRGFVMPNEAYLDMVDRQLRMAYPKESERLAIFAAWDELHHALRREQVLDAGRPPGAFPDYGISDNYRWRVTAPNANKTTLGQAISREINAIKNFSRTLAERGGVFDKSRPKAPRNVAQRFVDHTQAAWKSNRGMLKAIIARMPDEAKAVLQPIADSVATDPGSGRLTHENFHETVEKKRRTWNFQFGNIKEKAGYHEYNPMTLEERLMLRHNLVTGESTYPVDPSLSSAGRIPIPDSVIKVAGPTRQLLNELWHVSDDAGLKVGYAVNGFFPRHYDRYKAAADPAGFKAKASELYNLMFDKELGAPGDNPQALLEKWTELPRDSKELATAKAGSNVDLPAQMRELQKNLLRQGEIAENPAPTPAETTELARLKGEAQQLAADLHPLLRDFIAETNADSWHANLVGGTTHDFDTSGPTGKYLNARALPPEADIIMRDYMEHDPDVALPAYFNAVARRSSYAEQFGPVGEGEVLTKAKEALSRIQGADGADINKFFNIIDDMTGRAPRGGTVNTFLQTPHNIAQGVAAMVLMERAMWSSLHEGMTASMVTGDHRAGLGTMLKSVGQLFRTMDAKERTALAEFLGVITSPAYDNTMLSRMGAAYDDSPRMGWLLQQYYRTTGLTAITNGSRAASVGTSHWFINKLSQHLLDPDPAAAHARDNAKRWFNELGLPESIHQKFAQWIVDMEGKLPTPEALSFKPGEQGSNALAGENAGMQEGVMSGLGDAYGLAVRRLVDRIIQDPKPADRAMLANVPIIGGAFQLMSFGYSFHENVLIPAAKRILYQYTRGRDEAVAAGSGRAMANVKAAFGTTGAFVNSLAIATSMVAAATMALIVRQLFFAQDQLEKHAQEGDLTSYLLRTGASRSGIYGKWDPLQQAFNHLKYQSDLTSFTNGPARNWLGKNLNDVMAMNNSPNTNTAEFNQARAMYNLIGVPVAAYGLTLLGSMGPISRVGAGVALQFGTSPQASNLAGYLWAGNKGATLPKSSITEGLPKLGGKMGGLPKLQGGTGMVPAVQHGSGVKGLIGDVAIPAIGYTLGMIPLLKVPGAVAAGVAAAGGTAYGLYEANKAVAPFRNQPKPKPRPAR